MMYEHEVKTFNEAGRCLYSEWFRTAEEAYEEYKEAIRTLKEKSLTGGKITVARFREGIVMATETIEK